MNSTDITPVFILSLPRSGSTLLQKILATHENISTSSEGWVLIPNLYALKSNGIIAEYRHQALNGGYDNLFHHLPDGKTSYYSAVRNFAHSIYEKICDENDKLFVDKTPRYHLICDYITKAFPNAKYIVLWRNPLSVVCSMIKTFSNNEWAVPGFYVDIYNGIENLNTILDNRNIDSIDIRYEDIILRTEETIKQLSSFLGIPPNRFDISEYEKVSLKGDDDKISGINKYDDLSTEPIVKWKKVINNPLRKLWCKKYVRWLGCGRLDDMGYNHDNLLAELNEVQTSSKGLFADSVSFVKSYMVYKMRRSFFIKS